MSYWSVVVTQPRSEKIVVENLSRQAFGHYLPLLSQQRVVRGKKVTELVPLFPRYVFVRIEHDRWYSLKGTRGVSKLLTVDSQPQRIADRVIEQLQASEEAIPNVQSFWTRGEQVRVIDGAFAGMLGIYDSSTKADRERVFVSILGRQTLVEVPTTGLESVPPSVR
jgi:transcriptional antiterminator RfaH